MAFIHRTTMTPTKLELLADWLPKQSWYVGGDAQTPELVKAGGFRLDDPEGEVGIEFMVVVDAAVREPVAYLVPMGYRAEALEGAPGEALIGTSEHGVLGTRWVYDGVHDPVVTAQLDALLRGKATPQAQSKSDTPDPTVTVHGTAPDDGQGLDDQLNDQLNDQVNVQLNDQVNVQLNVQLNRVLRPEEPTQRPSAAWSPGGLGRTERLPGAHSRRSRRGRRGRGRWGARHLRSAVGGERGSSTAPPEWISQPRHRDELFVRHG
jgi:hypothetical protein